MLGPHPRCACKPPQRYHARPSRPIQFASTLPLPFHVCIRLYPLVLYLYRSVCVLWLALPVFKPWSSVLLMYPLPPSSSRLRTVSYSYPTPPSLVYVFPLGQLSHTRNRPFSSVSKSFVTFGPSMDSNLVQVTVPALAVFLFTLSMISTILCTY